MMPSSDKSYLSRMALSLASRPKTHSIGKFRSGRAAGSSRSTRASGNPLLNLSIGVRLALGFLIPALIAVFTLSSIGIQNQERLLQESTFYQNLFDAYTSLTVAGDTLEQMHINLQQTVAYAAQPDPLKAILEDDQGVVRGQAASFSATLNTYFRQDLLERNPRLVSLITVAGHGIQIQEQQTYSESVQESWQPYQTLQEQVLHAVSKGDIVSARALLESQVNVAFTDVQRELQTLISFNKTLLPSLQDAAGVEVQKLLISTLLAVLGVLLGIGIVGWLISSTLVKRLLRLRSTIQAIAGGEVKARLDARGRDEIADVSEATNTMVDTLVGLLEETKRQRDELANAEELQHLHQQLQQEHEALNEANMRLEALATRDPLTGLFNHRTVMDRVEKELSRCRRTRQSCAILFLDIDHFKQINDTWGHRAGDAILCEVSRRLVDTLRPEDFVGRYGGEEFAILLINAELEEARGVAERLCMVLAKEPCFWEAEEGQAPIAIPITGSFGVSVYQLHGNTREALIEAADGAMYNAKRTGRNRVCVAGEETAVVEKIAVVQELLTAASDRLEPEQLAIQALTAVAYAHDPGTSFHSVRMMQMIEHTAHRLECSEEETQLICLAALLHDIGKVGIPHHILHKPGPLTEEEWEVMRRHPKIGHQILIQAGSQFEQVAPIVLAHHERWDGKGYSDGLFQEAIPLGSRLIAVVDTYDAMISGRPYRAAMPISEARAELQRCAGSQFDPRVIEAFFQVFDEWESREEALALQTV